MLSFSSRTPGSSSGTSCTACWVSAAFRSRSIWRTKVACSSSSRRSSALASDCDPLEVPGHVVEHALERLLVLHLAVELGEHLIGVVDRRHRLVRPGVDPAGPGVGPVGHADAELQRAEPRRRLGTALQVILDLLVDRDARWPSRPACPSRPGCSPGTARWPVSRQLIPRMWPSPSPRILLEIPLRNSRRSRNDSSGWTISLRVKFSPSSSGQKAGGTVPLGLNMNTSRCLRAGSRRSSPAAQARLVRFPTKGSAAAETPRSRRNALRLRWCMAWFLIISGPPSRIGPRPPGR